MGYMLVVRKPIDFMTAIVEELYGNAHLSLEGNLSYIDLSLIGNASIEEADLLRRNTSFPEQDFVILPLENETKEFIIKYIFPQVGLRRNVHHILIEKEGELVFRSYDGFDPDGVWVTHKIEETFFSSLKESGIIKKYTKVQ